MIWARRSAGLAFACLALWVVGCVRLPVGGQTGEQTKEWVWMGGSNMIPPVGIADPGPPGVYGVEGVPNAKNIPGGRYYAVNWTDDQGNFWLFGGAGEDANENFGSLNDLWEFNFITKEWTWMSGSSTIPSYNGGQPGVYGQMDTPGAKNTPGGRTGAFGWADQHGNLWLFGGAGFDAAGGSQGILNDLWEYNIASGEWAWIGGSSTAESAGVYGTQGSLTSGSYPGSRAWGFQWTDRQGNFWMFGGNGQLNDLWKFVPSTLQWAWVSGSSTGGSYGNYGQLHTPASGNTPGARDNPGGWVDASGNLWLFGGIGYASVAGGGFTGNGFLNDLWEFSPATNEWTWMGGSNQITNKCQATDGSPCGSPGVNGTLGTASAANIPGARFAPIVWVDSMGNAWLMGGDGFGATDTAGQLNDLWKFNPTTNEWTWMGGPSGVSGSGGESGVYGTLGVAGAGNIPGGREGAAGWTGADGSFWLFGGGGPDANGAFGYLNDFWEYGELPRTASQ